ncbi:MAG: hypothetical protein ACKO7N_09625, partial [Candidatus Nitrosotenuis sp.]
VGLELDKKKPGEKTALDLKTPQVGPPGTSPLPSPKGQPQQGRPKNSTDQQKRKTKKFSPRTGASLQVWAMDAQDKISEILNPYLLDFYGKKNMRSLSSSEYNEAEATKTKIFLLLDPLVNITEELVLAKLNTVNSIDNNITVGKYQELVKNLRNEINREPTIDELKYTKAYFYQTVYSPE